MSDQEGELIKTGKIVIRNMAIIYMGLLGLVTIYTMLPINPIIVVSGFIVIIGVGCLLSVGIILMLYWHSKRLNIAECSLFLASLVFIGIGTLYALSELIPANIY